MGWENDPLLLMRIPRHTTVTPTGQLLDSADKYGNEGSKSKQRQKRTKLLENKHRSPAKLGPKSCSSSRSAKHEQLCRTPDFSLLEMYHLVSCQTWRWEQGFSLFLIFSPFAIFLMVCHYVILQVLDNKCFSMVSGWFSPRLSPTHKCRTTSFPAFYWSQRFCFALLF